MSHYLHFFVFFGMGAFQHSTYLSRQGTRSKVAASSDVFHPARWNSSTHTHSCGVLGGASPTMEGEIKAVGLEKHVVC